MNELLLTNLFCALIGSLATIITELIISWLKRFTNYPKLRAYTRLKKDNPKNYYFKYYSKFYNKDFLIVRLNVVNYSAAEGKLFDVKLYKKNPKNGALFTSPLGLPSIQQDEVLCSFLKTEKFSDDLFFVNDIKLGARDHKNIYMVFDATSYIQFDSTDKFTLFYNYSTRKLKTKKIKFIVPFSCSTDHHTLSEIIEFEKEYRHKNFH